MLQVESTFPHAGSNAYVLGTGARVRIIQQNADKTCVVQRMGPMARAEGASRTCRIPLADLVATANAAMAPARKSRRRRAA